jgi:hypothetical protein
MGCGRQALAGFEKGLVWSGGTVYIVIPPSSVSRTSNNTCARLLCDHFRSYLGKSISIEGWDWNHRDWSAWDRWVFTFLFHYAKCNSFLKGKTLFLYYLLVRPLQQKQKVLFSLNGSVLYLFNDDQVYRLTIQNYNAKRSTQT